MSSQVTSPGLAHPVGLLLRSQRLKFQSPSYLWQQRAVGISSNGPSSDDVPVKIGKVRSMLDDIQARLDPFQVRWESMTQQVLVHAAS